MLMDPQIKKCLPYFQSTRILIIDKNSATRKAKHAVLKKLGATCTLRYDLDDVKQVRRAATAKDAKRQLPAEIYWSRVQCVTFSFPLLTLASLVQYIVESDNAETPVQLILAELDREVAPKLCEYVRQRSQSPHLAHATLIPVILCLHDDPTALNEVLTDCLKQGAPGYLCEPVHMGQLALTTSLILKQYRMIQSAYASLQKEEGKAYPKLVLGGIPPPLPEGLNHLNTKETVKAMDYELSHVAKDCDMTTREPISSVTRREKLHRDKRDKMDKANPSTPDASTPKKSNKASTSDPQFSQYSATMSPHILRPVVNPPSPRSVYGLSRSKVERALKLVLMQDRAKDNKRVKRMESGAARMKAVHQDRRANKTGMVLPADSPQHNQNRKLRKEKKMLVKMATEKEFGRKGLKSLREKLQVRRRELGHAHTPLARS